MFEKDEVLFFGLGVFVVGIALGITLEHLGDKHSTITDLITFVVTVGVLATGCKIQIWVNNLRHYVESNKEADAEELQPER